MNEIFIFRRLVNLLKWTTIVQTKGNKVEFFEETLRMLSDYIIPTE